MHPLFAALALLIDRLAPGLDATRARPFAAPYLKVMREQFGDLSALGPLVAALFLIGVPVVAASLLMWLAAGLGGPVAVVLGLVLTLLAIGPRSALRALEAYPTALERDDEAGATAAAQYLAGTVPIEPVARSLAAARAMPQLLHDAALAPAFWCLLAGPVGVVAWRAALELERALAVHADQSPTVFPTAFPMTFSMEIGREARRVLGVLGYLPTRATALALAAMGRSELAFAEWRAVRAAQRTEAREAMAGTTVLDLRGRDEHLLAQVADAALRVRPDDEDLGLHLAWSMVALAERAWLTAIATLVALGALVWIA